MGESKLKQIRAGEKLLSCTGVQTPGGKIQVCWKASSAASPMGQLAYFIEFLGLTGLWSRWQETCPRAYTSPNVPSKADVLGTGMLSIFSGRRRYAHVTPIRCDGVNPGLLSMNKVIFEDAQRRALVAIGPWPLWPVGCAAILTPTRTTHPCDWSTTRSGGPKEVSPFEAALREIAVGVPLLRLASPYIGLAFFSP